MPYDNYKKTAPRYWREAEMLAMLESRMNNATSMTELAMWFEFAKSLSSTVKGFFAKLIPCKDQNKMRLVREENIRAMAEQALEVPVKVTTMPTMVGLSAGEQVFDGENFHGKSNWVMWEGKKYRWNWGVSQWENEQGTILPNFRFNK